MTVPANIQEQGKVADDLQQALILETKTPDTGTDPLAAPVVSPNDPPQIPVQDQQPQSSDLEQKYKSLQGRIDAQARELAVAKANNDLLYKQLADANRNALAFEAKLKEAEDKLKEPPKDEPQNSKLIDAERMAIYGPEFREMAEKINAALMGVQSAAPTTAEPPNPGPQTNDLSLFRADIIADVWAIHNLDYKTMDTSALFKDWLDMFDPVTGKQNGSGWVESIKVRDKGGCLRVINTFLSTPVGAQYQQTLKPANLPSQTPPNQQPDLKQAEIDPLNRVVTGDIWTAQKVNDFYKNVSIGKYKSNPEEQKRIEADIFAAQKDGRWRG